MYKVLLVDDEALIREAISENTRWKELGYELMGTCKNGREAMERLDQEEADLVLTDICMPYMDGMELTRYLYEHHRGVKVIIISGYDDFELSLIQIFLSLFHNFIDIRHIQIHDTVTSGTDEMVMPVGIAVKTVSTSVCGDLHDLTKVGQKRQISVDRSQTDVWKFLPDIHIDGIGSGMICPGCQKGFDGFSLFASFQVCHIFSPSVKLPSQRRCFYNIEENGLFLEGGSIYKNNNDY